MALVAALVTGGCALSRSGALEQNCTGDGECHDSNPCTVGSCSADGFCLYAALPDGDLEEQTAHDCRTERCEGGQPVTLDTPNDRPVDQPCTTYACVEMELEETQKGVNDPCELNDIPGFCLADGTCDIGCEVPGDCDDGNACTDDDCNVGTGSCINDPLNNVLAPGSDQVPGDCNQILCQDGTETDVIDDTDLPDDDNPCTDDLCNEGQPTNPTHPIDTPCTDPNDPLALWCNNLGTCVQCNGPTQCVHLPSNTFCGTRTCSPAGMCGQDCVGNNVQTPAQVLGDCKDQYCDGACGTMQVLDANDLPVDNNDCTQDLCTGMTPSNPNEPLNTACGSQGTLYCDSGNCVGCTNNGQCPLDVFCRNHYCNNQIQQCDWNDQPNDTPLPSQDQTTGDCQELRCDGNGVVKSSNIWDPFNDGIDCTQDVCVSGNPIHNPRPLNYGCNDNGGTYCDGNNSCVECNSATQCPAAPDCQYQTCLSNSCDTGNWSASTPAPQSYQTNGDCKTRVCNGSGGVNGDIAEDGDLPDDNNECTSNLCNSGTPSFPAVTDGTACTSDNLYCTGVEDCQGGACTSPGDPCGPDSDANCSACDDQDNDCNGNEPNLSPCDDGLHCTGTDTCNASGGCANHAGDPCAPYTDADCSGGCNEGNNGACDTDEPNLSACDDGTACNGTDTCNATGSCVNHTGNPCLPYTDADCSGGCNEGNNGACDADEPNLSPCDDGLYCTGTDTCNASGDCANHTGHTCAEVDNDPDCSEMCQETGGGSGNCEGDDPPGSDCNSSAGTCDGAGQCVAFACGTSPTPSSSGTCPDSACTGGCVNGVCTINCIGPNACQGPGGVGNIVCPSDKACVINCDGDHACDQSVITCPAGYACTILCNDHHSCKDSTFNCPTTDGVCDLTCSSEPSSCEGSTLVCGPNDCTATCPNAGKLTVTSYPSTTCTTSDSGC
ncbi:MAG: hypothetical protein DRI90_03060 [Deltaproteobacteria bacterium]|nr:MAG: hypothetical protein DRI90_03060 [Deltaproteobacteria bacterium]